MIYKDFWSTEDQISQPADRAEDCVNCALDLYSHSGWVCEGVPLIDDGDMYICNFNDYQPHQRYLTQSMIDSLKSKVHNVVSDVMINKIVVEPTIDQWQAWAHNQPGDCPCGIKREVCDYHHL